MNDQKDMWNQKHAAHDHANQDGKIHELAKSIATNLISGQKLLELGCGISGDADFFANLGLDVISTDFSDVVITQNLEKPHSQNMHFKTMDITAPFPHAAGAFDVVYAHLSLHYYDEPTTDSVFKEIARVLKPGGALYFSCKSTNDPKYGQGEEIEPGVFDRNGHIRHFFSLDYTRRLLSGDYDIQKIEEISRNYVDGESVFIECWATKR